LFSFQCVGRYDNTFRPLHTPPAPRPPTRMLVLLSPAKTLRLDLATPMSPSGLTRPVFQDDAEVLMAQLRTWSKARLKRDMALSDALADTVHAWHQRWVHAAPLAAGDAFAGDAFKSLGFPEMPSPVREEGQRRLRILHGLYGALSPFDAYRPVRLEMGQRWKPLPGIGSLAAFWAAKLPEHLRLEAQTHGHGHLLNLASAEYATPALKSLPLSTVTTCQFLESRGTGFRSVSAFAKAARGAMARFVLSEGITDPNDLKTFDGLGYRYNAQESGAHSMVFTRTSPS